jgi:hypothetical protein
MADVDNLRQGPSVRGRQSASYHSGRQPGPSIRACRNSQTRNTSCRITPDPSSGARASSASKECISGFCERTSSSADTVRRDVPDQPAVPVGKRFHGEHPGIQREVPVAFLAEHGSGRCQREYHEGVAVSVAAVIQEVTVGVAGPCPTIAGWVAEAARQRLDPATGKVGPTGVAVALEGAGEVVNEAALADERARTVIGVAPFPSRYGSNNPVGCPRAFAKRLARRPATRRPGPIAFRILPSRRRGAPAAPWAATPASTDGAW